MLYFTLQNQRRAGAAVAASGNFCSVFHDPPPFTPDMGCILKYARLGTLLLYFLN